MHLRPRISQLSDKPGALRICAFYEAQLKDGTYDPNYQGSNFFGRFWNERKGYDTSIIIGGKSYPTREHYFQAMKFYPDEDKMDDIRTQMGGRHAQRRAGELKMTDAQLEAWDNLDDFKSTAFKAMVDANLQCALQHKEYKEFLDNTKGCYMYEDTYHNPFTGIPDARWGGGDKGDGANKLGKAQMLVQYMLEKKKTSFSELSEDEFKEFEKQFEKQRLQFQQERREVIQGIKKISPSAPDTGIPMEDLVSYRSRITEEKKKEVGKKAAELEEKKKAEKKAAVAGVDEIKFQAIKETLIRTYPGKVTDGKDYGKENEFKLKVESAKEGESTLTFKRPTAEYPRTMEVEFEKITDEGIHAFFQSVKEAKGIVNLKDLDDEQQQRFLKIYHETYRDDLRLHPDTLKSGAAEMHKAAEAKREEEKKDVLMIPKSPGI